MALAIAEFDSSDQDDFASFRPKFVTIQLDNAYPQGGYALKALLGYQDLRAFITYYVGTYQAVGNPYSNITLIATYNPQTDRLQFFWTAPNAPTSQTFSELPTNTSLQSWICKGLAIGR